MSVKVFQTNKFGKIEFSQAELEKLLNEVYKEGYADGEEAVRRNYWTWNSPFMTTTTLPINYGSTGTTAITLCDSLTNNLNADKVATLENSNEAKITVETHGEAKDGKADITASVSVNDEPAKTYEVKETDFKDLNQIIADFLGIYKIPTNTEVNGAKSAIDNSPFAALEKELNSW